MDETSSTNGSSSGPAIDRKGAPVIDPTKNVLDLVEAAARRSDDLLALHMKRQDDLRSAYEKHTAITTDNSQKHLENILALTSKYEELLRLAETNRINAIRTVDVNAVAESARVSAAQALTLATQVTTVAEAMRVSVANTATAFATSLATSLEPITAAIAAIQKNLYEQQGQKQAVVEQRVDRRDERGVSQWVITTIIGVVFFFTTILISTGAALLIHFIK